MARFEFTAPSGTVETCVQAVLDEKSATPGSELTQLRPAVVDCSALGAGVPVPMDVDMVRIWMLLELTLPER